MAGDKRFPQEIVDLIVSYLAADGSVTCADLAMVSLVGRAWCLPSQRHLYACQMFGPPHGKLTSRLEWYQSSLGSELAHHVKEVQFWRLDADSDHFPQYWSSVLGTFPNVQNVGIHMHDAALQEPMSNLLSDQPSFPSVTRLHLSNVAFATCQNLLALVGTLPNLSSLHMERENWACNEMIKQCLRYQMSSALQNPLCDGSDCSPMSLSDMTIDCTDGLDLLECALRHANITKLLALNIALPSRLKNSGSGMVAFLLGLREPKPDFELREENIRVILSRANALETIIYRIPASVLCNPVVPPASPCLRHLALHYLRVDLHVSPTADQLYCISSAISGIVSPCLETVNITLTLSALAQLDFIPWEAVDHMLSDAGRFPILQECAFNVAWRVDRPSPRALMMDRVRSVVAERLPMLSAKGAVGVHEAKDFFLQ
ncbi:hypothetical protein C8Q79DRAFT_998138 [Trametes meyenii]|nr:hypothetical protein C8Q79DRAFT_998138 [Trametes meyenii]